MPVLAPYAARARAGGWPVGGSRRCRGGGPARRVDRPRCRLRRQGLRQQRLRHGAGVRRGAGTAIHGGADHAAVVLISAALLQAVAMVVFATASGVGGLLAARVLQGISTGAAAGAVGAGMLDIDRAKGTIANAVGPLIGSAIGGVIAGLLVQYLPAPTQLVYLVFGAIFIAQAIGVAFMPESVTRRPGALASLKPQFRLPPPARRALLTAAPVLVAAWALGGFYLSLGPSLVRRIADSNSILLGGLVGFVLAGSGAVIVLLTRARSARTVTTLGAVGLVVGVAITLLAFTTSSLPVFFAGVVLAGFGFGAGFQGAIRTVLPLAAANKRAGVLSILYVISYLAMGLPAVIGGFRVVHGGGVFTTAREYSIAVMVLAALALVGTLVRRPSAALAAPALAASRP